MLLHMHVRTAGTSCLPAERSSSINYFVLGMNSGAQIPIAFFRVHMYFFTCSTTTASGELSLIVSITPDTPLFLNPRIPPLWDTRKARGVGA